MQIGIRLHDTKKRDIGRTCGDRRGTGIFLCASCFEKSNLGVLCGRQCADTRFFLLSEKNFLQRIIWMLRYWDVI